MSGAAASFAESVSMAELAYAVLLEPDDGAFSVIVPALPEISTFGETPEQALDAARDAIALSLSYRRERGLEIPPSDADEARLHVVTIHDAA